MNNILILSSDDPVTKKLLIDCLKTGGFNINDTEEGILNIYLSQNELANSIKKEQAGDRESIFPLIPQLCEVFEFIELNYNQNIKLKEVAQAVGYSSAYLTDLVRRMTGKTVNNWIIERRITEARKLLLETEDSIEQIAFKVGYQNINHFYYQFRNYCQNTPGSWRNK